VPLTTESFNPPAETRTESAFVCGVDLGTTYAEFCIVAAGRDQFPAFAMFRTASGRASTVEGARDVGQRAIERLEPWLPTISVMRFEDPIGAFVGSVKKISRVQGAVAGRIPDTIALDAIMPGEWKKLCGLKGNANSAAYTAWASECLGLSEPLQENQAAAYGIACSILVDSNRTDGED